MKEKIKHIFRYLILFSLACILLYYTKFGMIVVNAESNTTANINSFNITYPNKIVWYDYINSAYQEKGNVNEAISITSDNDFLNLSRPSSNLSTSNGGSGATIRFNSDVILPNHSYALFLYLIDTANTTYSPLYSYLDDITTCNSNLNSCTQPTSVITRLAGQKSQYGNYYITDMIYRFTSTHTSPSYGIQVHFSSNNNVSFTPSQPQRGFIGYRLVDTTEYSNDSIENMIQRNQSSLNNIEGDIDVIQRNQQNTDTLITSENEQTRDIITSDGQETRQSVVDQTTTCSEFSKTLDWSSYTDTMIYGSSTATTTSYVNDRWHMSSFISIQGGYSYNITWNYTSNEPTRYLIILYDKNKNKIGSVNYSTSSVLDISSYTGLMYIKVQLYDTRPILSLYSSNVCMKDTDILDSNIANESQKTRDTLTDESSPNLDSLNNSAGWLPPGPVDSILNLPLTLLNSLTSSLSQSCTPINLTIPFVDTPFQIPCMNTIYSQIGGVSSLISWLSGVAVVIILYKYFLSLYKWIENKLSLNETNDIDDWGGV